MVRGVEDVSPQRAGDLGIVKQTTLAGPVTWRGTGVHTGRPVSMTAHPAAEAGYGIRFERTDLRNGAREFPVGCDAVVSTDHCTTLGNGSGATLMTVEHFMAALSFTGVGNVRIAIDGPEVPLMDGSAASFVEGILEAGVRRLAAPRRAIRVLEAVEVRRGDSWARLEPSGTRRFSCRIEFDAVAIGCQEAAVDLDDEGVASPVVRARTFVTGAAIRELQKRGLGNLPVDDVRALKDVIVIGDDGRVLNEDCRPFANEFASHKCLDAVGDLALAPAPIIGRFSGLRSGHALNVELLRRFIARTDAWRWEDGA